MDNTKKTKRKDIRRRALAALCAVTIAVLQCAVILTIDTESAYAGIKISVEYQDSKVVTVSDYGISSISSSIQITGDVGGESVVVNGTGAKVSKILEKAGIDQDGITELKIGNETISGDFENAYIIKSVENPLPEGYSKSDFENKVFQSDDDIASVASKGTAGAMTIVKSTDSIRGVTLDKSSIGDLEINKTAQLNATIDADKFYKDSSDFKNVTVKWTSSDPNIATVDEKGLVTVRAKGTASITAEAGGKQSSAATVNGKEPETTTTTKPAADPKDLGNATVKSDGKLVKGKVYTNSEMKSHLTLKDPNGKTIDKKNWDVISIDRDGNNYTVTIKASTTGKKNGYTGYNESTLKATKTEKPNKYKYTTRKYSGGGVTRSTRINVTGGETTSSLPPTVTYAPDRTITVKEVFLGSKIEDDQQESQNPWDDSNDNWNDDSSDDWTETEMQEEISLDFGPAVGSAAVAAAACGAGMVGRIRRFHVDTRAADAAASQTGKTKKLKLKK